jgi:phosphomannomutase
MNFGTAGIREIMGDGPNKLNLNTMWTLPDL